MSRDIHCAAQIGDVKEVTSCILYGCDVNGKDINQDTPLLLAAKEGHNQVIKALIQARANVNVKDASDRTPLHWAAIEGHVDSTKTLLQAGAFIDVKDMYQDSPLHRAASKGHIEVVTILIQAGADVNTKDLRDWTPLHWAAMYGHNDMVKALLLAGADVSIKYKDGKIAKELAGKDTRKVFEEMEEEVQKIVPKEIRSLGDTAVRKYLNALARKSSTSNVIRVMFVGHFGVGKTTIAMNLLEKKTKNIKSTDGIEVYINQCLYDVIKKTWHTKGNYDPNLHGIRGVIRVDFVDFAGQLIFYTTHQTYLTSRGLYLLVFNLAMGLNGEVEDENLYPSKRERRHVIDFLEYWIGTIVTYAKSEHVLFPKIVLIGTHRDRIEDKEVLETIKTGIHKVFERMINTSQLVLRDDLFINALNMDEDTKQRIRNVILEEGMSYPEFNERVPSPWVDLHKKLIELKGKGYRIIYTSTVRDLNQQLENPLRDEEVDIFLLFLHNLGHILYFKTSSLKDRIVLDPKFVIDAMKCFITCKEFIFGTSKNYVISLIKDYTFGLWTVDVWEQMRRSGRIHTKFVQEVWKKNLTHLNLEHNDHLLAIMEKLDLICKPMIYENGERIPSTHVLLPCMVDKNVPDRFYVNRYRTVSNISKQTIQFSSPVVLPPAIFNRLICSALALWEIHQGHLYNGLVVLKSGKHHLIEMERDVREIRVTVSHTNSTEVTDIQLCLAVKQFMQETIDRILAIYNTSANVDIRCTPSFTDQSSGYRAIGTFHTRKEESSLCQCEASMTAKLADVNLMRIAKELQGESLVILCTVLLNDAHFSKVVERKYSRFQCDVQMFYILQEWKKRTLHFSVKELCSLLGNLGDDFDMHLICKAMTKELVLPAETLPGTLQNCVVYPEFLNAAADRISYEYLHLGLELGFSLKEIERLRMDKDNITLEINRFLLTEWFRRNKEDATVISLTKAFIQCGMLDIKWIEEEFDLSSYINRERLKEQNDTEAKSQCNLS